MLCALVLKTPSDSCNTFIGSTCTWHQATQILRQPKDLREQQCLYIARWCPAIHAAKCNLIMVTSQRYRYHSLVKKSFKRPKVTLKERWNPVTSVILFWTILLRFRVICFWWICGGDSGFWLYQFALLRNERFRESRNWPHCAGWWACCGVLNGRPGGKSKTQTPSQHAKNQKEIPTYRDIPDFRLEFKWKFKRKRT